MPNRRKNAQNCCFFSSGRGVEDDDRLERERVRVGDSVASLMVRERPLPSKNGKRSERPEVFESRVFNHSWKKERFLLNVPYPVIYRTPQKSKTGST